MHKRRVVMVVGFTFLFVFAGASSAAGLQQPFTAPPLATAYVPNQLLVEFRAGSTARDVRDAVRAAGAKVVRVLPTAGYAPGRRLVLVQSANLCVQDLAAALARSSGVARTSPNYVYRVDSAPPDDPGLPSQWGLTQVGAPQAWETSVGSSDVVVASIDTGVDFTHPDLAANMWRNPGEIPGNGIDDDHNGYVDDVYGIDAVNHDSVPMDDFGHGTHTSGIVAAVGNNATGVAGVGWHTRIMALKFLNFYGWGTDAGAIECVDYVVSEKLDHGVNVVAINASWGWTHSSPLLQEAVQRAGDAGIVFCASAGNGRTNNDQRPHYPSCFPCDNVISVLATNSSDTPASFSNWGRKSVDLGAPGVSILSTLPSVVTDFFGGGAESTYGSWSGTSMAAPFVAGAVALCAATYPQESMSQRIARVLASVDSLPSLRGKCATGGRLDLSRALGQGPINGDVTLPQTRALGGDDLWHDVPVTLRLWATDGAGGSGVARTEWRLDAGAWHKGTSAAVPAPAATKATYSVEYRSTDRAGNVEATQSCAVKIDTTGPADAEIPGLALPASPFSGSGASKSDPDDVFSVTLAQGESLSVVGTWLPGQSFELSLFAPGTQSLDWVTPLAISQMGAPSETLTYCAVTSGIYYLDVRDWGGAGSYQIAWTVSAPGVDVTPPSATMDTDNGEMWFNRAVTLTIYADDGPYGSGVGAIESSMDDGLTWVSGAHPTVAAPADHSNDGIHIVRFRAHDLSGNVSAASDGFVGIDTVGPTTETWAPRGAVRQGHIVGLRFDITDLTGEVTAQLLVTSASSGHVVKTIDIGSTMASSPLMPSGFGDWWPLRCDLPRGTYKLLIAGTTHDVAGNPWQSAVCHGRLRVR